MTIISFKRRFIFLRPRKMAGTSLQIALSRFCGEEDLMSRLRFEESEQLMKCHYRYPVRDRMAVVKKNGEKSEVELGPHVSAREIRKCVGDDVFRPFLKISVTRNPYDRMVSLYAWRHRPKPNKEGVFSCLSRALSL